MGTVIVQSNIATALGLAPDLAPQAIAFPDGYVPAKGVAVMLRKRFAQEFPGTKFSVVTDGGNCIRVTYLDGPALDAVEGVTRPYRGGGFDGMIDLPYDVKSYLAPDCITMASGTCEGTLGSRGSVPPSSFPSPGPEWNLVRSGAHYIFVSREWSVAGAESFAAWARAKYPHAAPIPIGRTTNWQGKERAYFDEWKYTQEEPFGRMICRELSSFDARTGQVLPG